MKIYILTFFEGESGIVTTSTLSFIIDFVGDSDITATSGFVDD